MAIANKYLNEWANMKETIRTNTWIRPTENKTNNIIGLKHANMAYPKKIKIKSINKPLNIKNESIHLPKRG